MKIKVYALVVFSSGCNFFVLSFDHTCCFFSLTLVFFLLTDNVRSFSFIFDRRSHVLGEAFLFPSSWLYFIICKKRSIIFLLVVSSSHITFPQQERIDEFLENLVTLKSSCPSVFHHVEYISIDIFIRSLNQLMFIFFNDDTFQITEEYFLLYVFGDDIVSLPRHFSQLVD